MTDRSKNKDNSGLKASTAGNVRNDPRFVELVRLLARRSAEKDFASLVRMAQKARGQRAGRTIQ